MKDKKKKKAWIFFQWKNIELQISSIILTYLFLFDFYLFIFVGRFTMAAQ